MSNEHAQRHHHAPMRFPFTTSLLVTTLLLTGLSCRDRVEIQPTPPPIGPTCKIVMAIYKTIYISGSKTSYEQVTIGGKTYEAYSRTTTKYKYDDRGRLIHRFADSGRGLTDESYAYTATEMSVTTTHTNDGVVTQRLQSTVPLNAQGYDDKYLYNAQGHLLTYRTWAKTAIVNVEASNRTYHSEVYHGGGRLNQVWAFDLTRPALPQIRQFEGVGDKNLQTADTKIAQGIPYFTNGPVYHIDYHYEFDAGGRVKREIQLDTRYPETGWPFATNPGGIGVTDYEYECQ